LPDALFRPEPSHSPFQLVTQAAVAFLGVISPLYRTMLSMSALGGKADISTRAKGRRLLQQDHITLRSHARVTGEGIQGNYRCEGPIHVAKDGAATP